MREPANRGRKSPARLRRPAALLLMAVIALLPGGCFLWPAPSRAPKRITAFALATRDTAENVSEAFRRIEQRVFEAQLASATATYDPSVGLDMTKFEPFLEPDHLEARLTVLRALSTYATGLAEVMSDKKLKEFDTATREFAETLKEFSESDAGRALNMKTLDKKDLKLFATAVNAIGRWIIEYKRKRVTQQLVRDMDKHVQKICGLLKDDISTVGKMGMTQTLDELYRKQIRGVDGVVAKSYKSLRPPEQKQALRELAELASERRRAVAAMDAVRQSIIRLAQVHAKLENAFKDDDLTIDALICGLAAEAKRIKAYYETLEL